MKKGQGIRKDKKYFLQSLGTPHTSWTEVSKAKYPGPQYYSRSCVAKSADLLNDYYNGLYSFNEFLALNSAVLAQDEQLHKAAQKLPKVSEILDRTLENNPEYFDKMVRRRCSNEPGRGGSFYDMKPEKLVNKLKNAQWEVEVYNEKKGIIVLKTAEVSGKSGLIDIDDVKEDQLVYPVCKEKTEELSFMMPGDKKYGRVEPGSSMIVSVKDIKTGGTDFSKAACIDFYPGKARRRVDPDTITKDSEYFGELHKKVNKPISVQDLKKHLKVNSKEDPYIVSNLHLADQKYMERVIGKTLDNTSKEPDVSNGLKRILTSLSSHLTEQREKDKSR